MTSASFVYDPFGRRLAKTIGSATTNFLYDGVNPVQELVGGSVSANLLTGLGVDEYFNRTDTLSSGYFLTDALGSTLALADATGVIQTQYTYNPFGLTTTQGATSANSFQFTGRENDGTGLYFYRARYYSPMFGRFISEDPLGLRGGLGIYAYAANRPVSLRDPLGESTVSVGVSGGGGVGPLGGTGTVGILVDSQGNLAVYFTYGGGLSAGASATGGISAQYSNAQTVCGVGGPFANLGVGGGAGIGASAETFAGSDPTSGQPVLGTGLTVGAGIGAGGSVSVTKTVVIPLFGRKARGGGC